MTRPRSLLAAILAILLTCAGCDEEQAPPAKSSQTPPVARATSLPARATSPPVIPGVDENDSASDTVLVNRGPRKRPDRYKWDETLHSGSLRVICRLPFEKVELPPARPVDFGGLLAIKNPKSVTPHKVIYASYTQKGYDIKNELDYYKNWNPPVVESPLHWLVYQVMPRGVWAVNGAAIMVQGIRAGAREELTRGNAVTAHIKRGLAQKGRITGAGNYSGFNIAFLPQDEKILLSSHDHFPCEIAVKNLKTGAPLGKATHLPAYPFPPEGKQGAYGIWGSFGGWWMPGQYRPKYVPSPTFRAKGMYAMRCLRHPWQVGYAIVVDNPYVAVSGAPRDRAPNNDGKITIDKIPPGTWKVRVWHPLVEPVKEIHEVEIETDETFHLIVEFKPPKELQDLMK